MESTDLDIVLEKFDTRRKAWPSFVGHGGCLRGIPDTEDGVFEFISQTSLTDRRSLAHGSRRYFGLGAPNG